MMPMKGPAKGGAKKSQGPSAKGGAKKTQDPPLHPYEEQRLRHCMQNSARLQQLGIPTIRTMLGNAAAISQDKNKKKHGNREDSGSEYDPVQDDTSEEDELEDDSEEGSNGKTHKKTNKQTPTTVKFQTRKRVYAAALPNTGSSSKRINSVSNASRTPCAIQVPPLSRTNVTQVVEPIGNFEHNTQEDGDGGIPRSDGHNHLSSEEGGGDDIGRSDDHNHLSSEAIGDVGGCNDDNTMVDRADAITHSAGDNQMINEELQGKDRGLNMGHALERMSRSRRGKLTVVINEGNIRPVVPLVAAKFATECNIVVRNHVPILTHWKKYKNQRAVINLFLAKLCAKFDIDTNNPTVRKGCLEMMKSAVRQQRHKLKKKYFDPFPLHLVPKKSPVTSTDDKQWLELVESWKNPAKMEVCNKNKDNRGNVMFHQTTGSCSYEVTAENHLGDEFENKEPDALDLFKVCHFRKKKKGYTPIVQLAIDEMQKQLSAPPTEGELPKSATDVVAAVLDKHTKKNRFLQNVGIKIARQRRTAESVEAELAAERMANADLQSKMDDMSKKMQETEDARRMDQVQLLEVKKQAELEETLARILAQNSTR